MMHQTRAADPLQLAVITSTFPYGPGEMFLRPELQALAQMNFDITVFPAVARTHRATYPTACCRVKRFPLLAPTTLVRAVHGFFCNAAGSLDALTTLLRARSSFVTRAKNVALYPTGLAVADEVVRQGISHIHAYWLSGASTVALVASKVARVQWSFSAHSWDIFMADNLIAEKTRSASFGRVISQLGRRGIIDRTGDAADKLEVIHLGVANSGLREKRNQGGRLQPIRILCPTANLIPVKGHTYLLQAIRAVIDAGTQIQCVLTGDGPLRSSLLQEVKSLRLENAVQMPGRIQHDELLRQLRDGSYDLVVLSSVERGTEFEGIPVSLMEAMGAGIPCIATTTGAIAELLGERCGILVPEKDPRAIAQAILDVASHPQLRAEIRDRGAHRVAREFDARASAQALRRLLLQAHPAGMQSTVGEAPLYRLQNAEDH